MELCHSCLQCIVVTGSVVASIGVHLAYSALNQATATSFDFYMALVTVMSIMLISVYAPLPSLRRMYVVINTECLSLYSLVTIDQSYWVSLLAMLFILYVASLV